MTIIDTRVIKNTVKFQAIHRELCNIVHHTVLAASVQVYELSILSLRAKIRSRVVTMNNQTRISEKDSANNTVIMMKKKWLKSRSALVDKPGVSKYVNNQKKIV